MKGRPKPFNQRKPYCRKKGGAAFHFKGGAKSPRATANFLNAGAEKQKGIVMDAVKSMLQKMGFHVGQR